MLLGLCAYTPRMGHEAGRADPRSERTCRCEHRRRRSARRGAGDLPGSGWAPRGRRAGATGFEPATPGFGTIAHQLSCTPARTLLICPKPSGLLALTPAPRERRRASALEQARILTLLPGRGARCPCLRCATISLCVGLSRARLLLLAFAMAGCRKDEAVTISAPRPEKV